MDLKIGTFPLRVCNNRRIHLHKVFKGIAQRGHSSIGWFFGFYQGHSQKESP